MKVLYFAWIRERIGKNEETIDLPADVNSVDAFLDWMARRGEEYAYALENAQTIRIALDQVHCTDTKTSLQGVSEIALFPPMTGG